MASWKSVWAKTRKRRIPCWQLLNVMLRIETSACSVLTLKQLRSTPAANGNSCRTSGECSVSLSIRVARLDSFNPNCSLCGLFSSRLDYDFLFGFFKLVFFPQLSHVISLKRNMKTPNSLHLIIKHQCGRRNQRRIHFHVHLEGKFGNFRGLG